MNSNVKPLKASDPTSFGGWEIKGRLGEGGYSTIFLGEKNEKFAAVKMIRKDLMSDTKVFERFVTEINNLEKLQHPGIARFIECDLATNVPFIAVEYVEGKTLEQYVLDDGTLSESEWLNCLEKVAEALKYCHENMITHKDVSPGNIILSPVGPKLIDFGISYRVDDPRVTQSDETVGTPAYMSPEHWAGQAKNGMDIFSLGSTMVYAASGKPAFSGDSKSQIQISTTYESPLLEGLSKSQKAIVTPMLYKKIENRPSLDEIIEGVANLRIDKKFIPFHSYLKGSEGKLIEVLHPRGKTRKFSKLATVLSFATLIGVISFVLLVSSGKEVNTNNATDSVISPQISELNQEADSLFFQKDYEGAYQVAIKSASQGNAQGMLLAGKSLEFMGETKKAIIWYEKSCKKNYPGGCFNNGNLLLELKRDSEALIYLKKAVALGDVRAMTNLGVYFRDKGDQDLAITYFKEAAGQKDLSALWQLGIIFEDDGNLKEALKWYVKASNDGYVPGSMYAGFTYKSFKSYELAKKYFNIAVEQGEPGGYAQIGDTNLLQGNPSEAEKYYLLGANLNEPFSGNGLATFYFEIKKDDAKACFWAKKVVQFKDIDQDNLVLAKKNLVTYCKAAGIPIASPSTTPAPSPSKTKAATPTPSVTATPKPIASSDSFKVSAPVAANAQIDEIFGRAFKNGLSYWVIPLTNVKGAKVPEITTIQFRLIGYPDAGWLDVPYKLKTDPDFGTVYAEVDDFLFDAIFKDIKYCPEFRAAREENGKIVRIWNKGKPDCATDYNP